MPRLGACKSTQWNNEGRAAIFGKRREDEETEEEEEEEDEDEEEDEEEEEEEECRKFSPKHCQKLQFSIAQIMGFDSSEGTQNSGQGDISALEQDRGLQEGHGDEGDQGYQDQLGRGRWPREEGERQVKDVKVDMNLFPISVC